MKRPFRVINPMYWINVWHFGRNSADAGCSVKKSVVDNAAIQTHSIMRDMGCTDLTQEAWIAEASKSVEVAGDFIRK